MKVGLITLSFWPRKGGMEFVVHDLANALHDLGHEVYVFAPRVRENFQEINHDYNLVRFGWLLPGAYRYGINRLVLIQTFRRLHRTKSFDAVNVHSAYVATTYACDLKRRFGVPVIATCHGQDIQRKPEISYGYRLDPPKDRIIRRNLSKVDLVVSISNSIYTDLIEILPKHKVMSIPNGIHTDRYSSAQHRIIRKRFGLETGNIVLSVGRNTRKKAFDIGIRAFAIVAREMLDTYYVHIGRNGEPLTKLAKELGIASQFLSLGELSRIEVLGAYQEADVFFSPASVEAFALVNLEAMASGLPCVVTDGPGNRDSIVHGKNGWIVPVGNVEAMANALLDLLQNKAKREAFADVSRQLASQYDWRNIGSAYIGAFESVIGAKT